MSVTDQRRLVEELEALQCLVKLQEEKICDKVDLLEEKARERNQSRKVILLKGTRDVLVLLQKCDTKVVNDLKAEVLDNILDIKKVEKEVNHLDSLMNNFELDKKSEKIKLVGTKVEEKKRFAQDLKVSVHLQPGGLTVLQDQLVNLIYLTATGIGASVDWKLVVVDQNLGDNSYLEMSMVAKSEITITDFVLARIHLSLISMEQKQVLVDRLGGLLQTHT